MNRNGILDDKALRSKSVLYRIDLIKSIKRAGAGHTGGSLSCVDILNVLYNRILRVFPQCPEDPDRDRYIQSKGHSVEALYVVLADRGFFPAQDLETLCRYGSALAGHPTRKVPGIEHNTGALGHGLPVGVGMALAAKLDRRGWRVFVLLGDGELTEGSIWEAMLTAAHYKLDNLVVIVDRNGLQITGPTDRVCKTDPLVPKFESFGWTVRTADGHDIDSLTAALTAVPFGSNAPSAVIAETVKGKGVSFIENRPEWHHRVPDDEQYRTAVAELEAQLRAEGAASSGAEGAANSGAEGGMR